MLLCSFLSCLPSLLLSSPCSLRSSCSCRAAASARWKPLVGSVLATIGQQDCMKWKKFAEHYLDISSFMGAKAILGRVAPASMADDVVYNSLVLINLEQV